MMKTRVIPLEFTKEIQFKARTDGCRVERMNVVTQLLSMIGGGAQNNTDLAISNDFLCGT